MKGSGTRKCGINKQQWPQWGHERIKVSIPREVFEKEFVENKLQNIQNKNVVEKNYKKKTKLYFIAGVAIFIATFVYLAEVHGAIRKVCSVELDNGTITKTYENCKRSK